MHQARYPGNCEPHLRIRVSRWDFSTVTKDAIIWLISPVYPVSDLVDVSTLESRYEFIEWR